MTDLAKNYDDDKGYLVDFEKKNWDLDIDEGGELLSEDMKIEAQRRRWEQEAEKGL